MPFIQLSNEALRNRIETTSPAWIREHAINVDSDLFVHHRVLLKHLSDSSDLYDDDTKTETRTIDRKINLLHGCKVIYKLPESSEERAAKEIRRKEYDSFMQKFRDLQDEKEFLNASGLFRQSENECHHSVNREWKTVQGQISGVVNVLFSVAAVFTAAFYLGELGHIDVGIRVLFALFAAGIVAVAEGWFFTKDLLDDHDKESR